MSNEIGCSRLTANRLNRPAMNLSKVTLSDAAFPKEFFIDTPPVDNYTWNNGGELPFILTFRRRGRRRSVP